MSEDSRGSASISCMARTAQAARTAIERKGTAMSERISVVFSSTNKNFLYNCEIPVSMLPRNGDRIRLSIPGHSDIRCYVEDMEWQYAELEKRIDISIVARVKILKED